MVRRAILLSLAAVALVVVAVLMYRDIGPVGAGRGESAAPRRAASGPAERVDPGMAPDPVEEARSVEQIPLDPPVEDGPSGSRIEPADEQPHVSIHGMVRDELGVPVEAAELVVLARDERGANATDRSIEKGAYEIRGLEAGSYWVSARAFGWKGEPRPIQLASNSDSARLDLVLTRAALVLVRARTPAGEPFRPALEALDRAMPEPVVIVSRDPPNGEWFDPATANDATYRSIDERAGEAPDVIGKLELHANPPLHVSIVLGHRPITTERLEPFAAEVVFVIDVDRYVAALSTLSFRIVDAESGSALPDAIVSLATTGTSRSTMVPVKEGGEVWIPDLTPGPGLLTLVARGFEDASRELVIPPGEDVDLGTIELVRSARLTGRVTGPEGHTNTHALLRSKAGLERSSHQALVFVLPIEESGVFDFPLSRGEHLLWAEAELDGTTLRSRAHVVDPETIVGPLVLDLERTVPLLVHSSRFGEDRRVSVLEVSGLPIGNGGSLGGGPVRFDVLPGPHRLLLESPSGALEERALDVGPGGLEVDLD